MGDLPREITSRDIDRLFSRYIAEMESVGDCIDGLRGLRLLSALKRDVVGAGPYPNVTLFEAANRIMTDLVMLHGVRWLLKHEVFPFRAYRVEYGHGNEGAHDIEASEGGKTLIGEVFNVAPSFFPIKKAAALRSSGRRGSTPSTGSSWSITTRWWRRMCRSPGRMSTTCS